MKLGFASIVINPLKPAVRFSPVKHGCTMDVKGDLEYRLLIAEGVSAHQLYVLVSCPLADIEYSSTCEVRRIMTGKIGHEIDLTLVCTHTHYSVNVNEDQDYRHYMAEKLAEAVLQTKRKEYDQLCYDRVISPFDEVGRCRISGEKSNVYLETLRLYDHDQRIATIIVYNSHPTTLNFNENYLSSAGPGLLLKWLGEKYPDEFFLYMMGPSGDVSTRYTRRNQQWSEVERLTSIVFGEVDRQLGQKSLRLSAEPVRFEEYWLPVVRKYLDISALKVPANASEREKETLREAGSHGDRVVPAEQLPRQILFQRLSFGNFHYIFTPLELFSEYLEYCHLETGTLVNCANDRICYLSGLKNQYLSFELFGESIALESKHAIIDFIEKWSS